MKMIAGSDQALEYSMVSRLGVVALLVQELLLRQIYRLYLLPLAYLLKWPLNEGKTRAIVV